ncbi:dynein light chain Tctex-type protein 2B-like [Montipora capricornis]|uniref:dynein light chain Tctex-type protein 2B-like n=1 Tax=Montipora foliosa TaxID=591990 RepID=UPI0035F1B1D2
MMPASDVSSRRSSMAFTDVQKTAVNILDPNAARQRTYSASSSTKPAAHRRSVNMNARTQQSGQVDLQAPGPRLANTYKLCPDAEKRFRSKDVKDIIDSVLEKRLRGMPYDADKCRSLLPIIVDEIKEKVKLLGFERFKLVCLVTIGKLNNQGVRVASRCLWDTATDRMATSSFCSDDLFASAVVFGIYRE